MRDILLMGVFWRILFIEGVLLVYSLGYRWFTGDTTLMDLLWYSLRITLLVIIIVAFMMVTLKKFLDQRIIAPLEAIASSNQKIQKDISRVYNVDLPANSPYEITSIITTGSKMLKTILDISEERLKYSRALDDELERGKKIQKDFLPRYLPEVKNCEIASYFHSALQLSGDFYDVFALPDNHIGFVIGDVSGKGVGSSLFMALTRSLVRIFSGSFNAENDSRRPADIKKGWGPEDALKTVFLTNDYIAREHGEESMFVTLFFGAIDLFTGKMFYINGGHEPFFTMDKNRIKRSLTGTGPALGPIPGALYKVETIQLQEGDMIFGYTDGVTEARSENKDFYTRSRLENRINTNCHESADAFLEAIRTDLFAFTGEAPQSDDITMLAIKWLGLGEKLS